jgi:hypothetical protein
MGWGKALGRNKSAQWDRPSGTGPVGPAQWDRPSGTGPVGPAQWDRPSGTGVPPV